MIDTESVVVLRDLNGKRIKTITLLDLLQNIILDSGIEYEINKVTNEDNNIVVNIKLGCNHNWLYTGCYRPIDTCFYKCSICGKTKHD